MNILETSQIFLAKLLRKPVSVDIWHYCFGYIEVDTIRNIIKNGLANMLNIVGNLSIKDVYKNSIFEKIHNLLHDNNVVFYKIKVIEYIYVDLWKPFSIISARSFQYFMFLIDKVSLF